MLHRSVTARLREGDFFSSMIQGLPLLLIFGRWYRGYRERKLIYPFMLVVVTRVCVFVIVLFLLILRDY